jgi:hypothetical protein
MSDSENETIILINDADVADGFFRFSTSKPKQFAKLCKRIGGEAKLISVQHSTQGARVVSWTCKVPIAYLSKTSWGIGPKRKGPACPPGFKKRIPDGPTDA